MKHTFKLLLLSLMVLPGCAACYDPALEHPDGHGGGYNLTPLGCLIYGPWKPPYQGKNITIRCKDSVLVSYGEDFTALEKALVFELERNGTVRYWLDSTDESALLSSGKIIYKSSRPYKPDSPEKVPGQFTGGKWTVNYQDSSIDIEFQDPAFVLPPIRGKYADLGSDGLALQITKSYDTVIHLVRTTVSRIETTFYSHTWVYSFD
ncbi:hypothetical protein Q4E93_19390 [Flavitalea sp. BT771]|uniref:hypothetical protein n=1 Tax=Flavitalea sp. BT771 TaxID=3063329 RepID=UPI0026E467F3|nr:hypothetical protein [Flavitalea sp. BT771]MDO6432780.1 hypothetical protein [Flavitalea sp. BT771]MDV6221944.1 hypothetical protein [Flavitalea sp. BT771]